MLILFTKYRNNKLIYLKTEKTSMNAFTNVVRQAGEQIAPPNPDGQFFAAGACCTVCVQLFGVAPVFTDSLIFFTFLLCFPPDFRNFYFY